MNTNTGEIRNFADGETIPKDFVEIPEEFKEEARKMIAQKKTPFYISEFPPSSDLRVWGENRMASKKNKKKKRRISNKSRNRNRK